MLSSTVGRRGSSRSAGTKASRRSKSPGSPRIRSCASPSSSRLMMSASTAPRSPVQRSATYQPLVMSVTKSPARRAASRSSGRSCRSSGSPPHTTTCAIPARPASAYRRRTDPVSSWSSRAAEGLGEEPGAAPPAPLRHRQVAQLPLQRAVTRWLSVCGRPRARETAILAVSRARVPALAIRTATPCCQRCCMFQWYHTAAAPTRDARCRPRLPHPCRGTPLL